MFTVSVYTTALSKTIGLHPNIKFICAGHNVHCLSLYDYTKENHWPSTLYKIHFYADDTQLYAHLSHKNTSVALSKLNACHKNIQRWMTLSKMKLNPDKTEFILFGSKGHPPKINSYFLVNVLSIFFIHSDTVKNEAGGSMQTFTEYIPKTCKIFFLQMHNFCRIRQFLIYEVAILAANALVSSSLDYFNYLFRTL